MKEVINCPYLPKSLNSHAVKCNNMIYTSGQTGRSVTTGELMEGIKQQTWQALSNLKKLLEYSGSSLENVIKITIFISDIKLVSEVNAVYYEIFKTDPPARSCVQVARLAPGVLIELEAVACVCG